MDEDEQHLKVLSICHYVYGGLCGLLGLIPLIYVALGVMFLTMPLGSPGPGQPPAPPREMGYFFIVFGGIISLVVWVIAGCIIVAGRFLGQHRNRIFCIVMAAIACLNAPLGTVLGVFTLIVLLRPSVADRFAERARRTEQRPQAD